MQKYHVIGVMSGSSMDGLDLAYCTLEEQNSKWNYEIIAAETIPYDEKWRLRLSQLYKQPAFIYPKTDLFYGKYIGQLIHKFIQKHQLHIDFIASHGHTIFHQPENSLTAQIGHGGAIHAETGLPVVSDFRTIDVMLGGQGAPLVPIGDELLFSDYDACLNLGGFANISYKHDSRRVAFDICPCNIILNRIARTVGKPYDNNGEIASQGEVDETLLHQLNSLEFYSQQKAKSLGREWINTTFWPIAKQFQLEPESMLATFCEHIAEQIAPVINQSGARNILVTGGGAFNKHLIKSIETKTDCQVVIPDEMTVNYKEALIFAFLGTLRLRNANNCLQSVTGASRDNVGGSLYGSYADSNKD